LHQRAARWYEQNGFTIEALNHALLGGDYERAARLVEQGAMIMLARGEIVTIKNWIARLPADLVKSRPWLCIFNAWSFMVIGQHERAEAFLKIAEQLSGIGGGITDFAAFNEERRDEIGHIAAVRAHVACTKGETQLAIELAAKALEVLSAGNQVVRSSLAFVLGEAYFFNGMLDKAEQAWTEAARQSKENGVVHVTMPAMSELAKICKIRGELNRAADLYWDALQLVKEQGEQRFYVLGPIDIGLADLMREWNFLEAASCGLSEGIMRSEKWGSPNAIVFGYVTLARLLHAQNDLQKTSEALQKAEDLAEHSNIYPDVICELNKSRVQFWLEQGRLSDANNWLAEKEKAQSVDKCYGLETMTRARVYIALGKPAKALEMLRPVEQIAKENGYTGIKIEALVIQSMAYKANDQPAQALAALREALTAGMTEDYVRIFVGEGKPVISLLSILNRQITSADPLRPYIEKLLAAVEKGDETDDSLAEERLASDYGVARCAEDGFVLVEALSERELEVLSLISDGLTNSDIAKELYISTGTVRAHTASIYRKLDVSSRTQAVARARSLNLLQNQK
jgi:LuxR family maltose regulon positive regulatory protein